MASAPLPSKKLVAPVTPSLTFVAMLSVSDCHVHPPSIAHAFICCIPLFHFFSRRHFLAADSSFGVFEEMVKSDCHKDCAPISLNDEASPINNSVPFLTISNMIILRNKAEALLPILLVLCLCLNSSSSVVHQHKSILAPIFAPEYFFNRAKILPFSIQSGRNKRGNMTPKAMASA
jgi:hypothetical protein